MNEPRRYKVATDSPWFGNGPYVDADGEYVRYEDYARLKAKVERLTKAGDALHSFLIDYIVENRLSSAYLNKLDDGWLAAKEGKDQP